MTMNNNANADDITLDLPIAVATLVPPPPSIYGEVILDDDDDPLLPHTTSTTIDRITNANDGSLSITVKVTTHYSHGYRTLKIEHYHIPSDMARVVSESLDYGQMPSSSYLTMEGQHTLPPPGSMPETTITTTSGNNNGAVAVTTTESPSQAMTMEMTNTPSSRGRRRRVQQDSKSCNNTKHDSVGMFRMCGGLCWCSACTMCLGMTVGIVIVIVTICMLRPWE